MTGVDIFKLFFAWCVVEIHWSAMTRFVYPSEIEWLINNAVPFFFVASGYLLSRKMGRRPQPTELRQRSLKSFKLFLLWIIIYIPLDATKFIFDGFGLRNSVSCVITLILSGEGIYSWPMWYVYSLAISLLIMSVASKYRYGFVMLFLLMCGINLAQFYHKIPIHALELISSRALGGTHFILAGWLMPRLVGGVKTALVGFGLVLASYLSYIHQLPFWTLIGGVGFFYVASSLSVLKFNSTYIRKTSVWIYYLHMYMVVGMSKLFIAHLFELSNTQMNLITLLCVTSVGALLSIMQSRRLNRLLG